jgi:hypothetical protein
VPGLCLIHAAQLPRESTRTWAPCSRQCAAPSHFRFPSPKQTRPMMEMVRNAVFNMIMSLYGCTGGLPDNTR